MSASYLRMVDSVSATSCGSSVEAFSKVSARTQSSVSLIEGGFFRSSLRTAWTAATTLRASCSETPGTRERTISSSRWGVGKSM